MRYLLAALAAVLVTLAIPAPSHAARGAVRLEAPTRHVSHVRITYVQPARANRVWVEFNTGSLWSLRVCPAEDSSNCYWDARKQGNGHGRSFATIKGKTYYR